MTVAAVSQSAAGDRDAHGRAAYDRAGICTLAEEAPLLSVAERTASRDRILGYARQWATPATGASPKMLYPAVPERLDDPLIEVSMNYDRLAIRRWIFALEAADVRDLARFQALLYGLDALVRVHRWKQNELLLALTESSPASPRYGC
jgi:hypothetical protein